MKFPKTFRIEKNLDGKIEDLITNNPAIVKTLFKKHDKFIEDIFDYETCPGKYDACQESLKDFHYEISHIELFNQQLHRFCDVNQYSGYFLSAMINKVIRDDDTIYFEKVGPNVGDYLERGTIIIEGDADFNIGCFLKGGRIIVKGNAMSYVGYCMEAGSIEVWGDISESVAYYMKGGKILIKGNAGRDVALGMEGGNLFLEGEVANLGNRRGGVINHRGSIILPNIR
ncbi:MAG: hypothetical protein KKA79_08105 [Nanoarchaeota archaeon]|nr:hypothetical protein [Nanoarchaeota archaeon]MCG2717904.1 hypothetical protein [Nanoarchaeota archaeon]